MTNKVVSLDDIRTAALKAALSLLEKAAWPYTDGEEAEKYTRAAYSALSTRYYTDGAGR